jgi:hypothetical protein
MQGTPTVDRNLMGHFTKKDGIATRKPKVHMHSLYSNLKTEFVMAVDIQPCDAG